MPLFHADATRSGAEWLVHITELGQSRVARGRAEITPIAYDLITAQTGLPRDQVELVVRTERDVVRARAARLGFETVSASGSRTDTFELPEKRRAVSVRYDDYGAVVGVDASAQVAEFQTTRDGAFDALFYTAQYSDIRRRRLQRDEAPASEDAS